MQYLLYFFLFKCRRNNILFSMISHPTRYFLLPFPPFSGACTHVAFLFHFLALLSWSWNTISNDFYSRTKWRKEINGIKRGILLTGLNRMALVGYSSFTRECVCVQSIIVTVLTMVYLFLVLKTEILICVMY